MCRVLIWVFFLLTLGFAAGCNRPAAPEKNYRAAIERVLRADKKLAQTRDKLPPKATPSQAAWAIGNYVNELEHLNMTDCPADFRVAYKQHMRAWQDAQTAVQQLPDGFLEGVFAGAFNLLLRGELDGGTGRLEGDLKRAIERVRTTREEIEKIGAKYGVALE